MSDDTQESGLAPGIGDDHCIEDVYEHCPRQTQILLVTVRRDFPLRNGEQLGDWQWSDADGNRRLSPMCWEHGGGDAAGSR